MSRHACIPNEETVNKPLHQTSSAVNTDTSKQDIGVDINLPRYSDSEDCDSEVCVDEHLSDSSDNEEELLFVDGLLDNDYSSDDQTSDVTYDQYLVSFFRMLLRWQALFYVSDQAFAYLILLFKSLLYLISSTSEFDRDNFKKFVVCPKCFAVYELEDCIEVVEGSQTSKQCKTVVFSKSPSSSLS